VQSKSKQRSSPLPSEIGLSFLDVVFANLGATASFLLGCLDITAVSFIEVFFARIGAAFLGASFLMTLVFGAGAFAAFVVAVFLVTCFFGGIVNLVSV
jgi:hypothetical protein